MNFEVSSAIPHSLRAARFARISAARQKDGVHFRTEWGCRAAAPIAETIVAATGRAAAREPDCHVTRPRRQRDLSYSARRRRGEPPKLSPSDLPIFCEKIWVR